MIDTELEVEEVVLDKLLDQKDLIVFNDDVNTFDHVISSLSEREKEVLNIYTKLNRANQHKMNPIPVCVIPK